MTRTRYTTPARPRGNASMRRATARLAEEDARRRAFVRNPAPEVECAVRKRLVQRLDGFHCDLQAPHAVGPAPAETRIVSAGARGLSAADAVGASMKATGPNPRMSVCGRPFRSDDSNGAEGGATGVQAAPAPSIQAGGSDR